MRRRKIPWPVNEYFLDEENKVIYLKGSWMRSMCLANGKGAPVDPDYEIRLTTQKHIHELKVKHYDKTQEDRSPDSGGDDGSS